MVIRNCLYIIPKAKCPIYSKNYFLLSCSCYTILLKYKENWIETLQCCPWFCPHNLNLLSPSPKIMASSSQSPVDLFGWPWKEVKCFIFLWINLYAKYSVFTNCKMRWETAALTQVAWFVYSDRVSFTHRVPSSVINLFVYTPNTITPHSDR